jgi:hypothetical protein
LGEIKLVFYRKTVDHVEAEVRTPQRAEKRSEDSRKESKSSSAVSLGSMRAGKRRKEIAELNKFQVHVVTVAL